MKKIITSALLLFAASGFLQAQTFTAGNLAVFVAASNSANNTTGSILELSPTSTVNPVNTYTINGTTGSTAIRFSGSATSTEYLANSNDSTLLFFTGGATTTTTANINTILPRAVGSFNSLGAFNIAATYTGT